MVFFGAIMMFPCHSWATGPLRVHPTNPRYFTDDSGRAIYLTGSHTWCNFQDCGASDPPPVFDYTRYLDFLQAHHHNFIRLWRAENSKGGERGDDFWFEPMPYLRSGPGFARDGKLRFDLTQFNEAYFSRIRARVVAAGLRGIYVSIMLFDGWSVESKSNGHNPWPGHPFHRDNNVNGVDGDTNGDGQGAEIHTLGAPFITALEEAYVKKVVDSVNDLDNVLYEISNESHGDSVAWQYHMVDLIHHYEAGKPKQHPVGMTVTWPNGQNDVLYASPADWVSPRGDVSQPPVANGAKVIVYDTDHLCGICGDPKWPWKSLMRGCNPIFMDAYDKVFTGRGAPEDYEPSNSDDTAIRENMGRALALAMRIDLAAMVPCRDNANTVNGFHGLLNRFRWNFSHPGEDMSSSGFCLTHAGSTGAEYFVYLPSGGQVTVDLAESGGMLKVEWLNADAEKSKGSSSAAGGYVTTLNSPLGSTHCVLHIYQ